MNKIEIIIYDSNFVLVDSFDLFDTMKEARAWVKEAGLDEKYWDRRAEVQGWARRNVHSIQLWKNNEFIQDWFPEWK